MSDGHGHQRDARDWTAPRDPERLAGLLGHFAALAASLPGEPVMVSACPSWFDDVYWSPREVAIVGRLQVATSGTWFEAEGWADPPNDEGTPPTAEAREAARMRRIEKELAGADPRCAALARALLEAIHGDDGPLGRDAVEAACHPLESEEIVAFYRAPDGVPMLLLTHSNGWTDVAYALDGEGRLLVWPSFRSEEAAKDDRFPLPPPRDEAIEIATGASPRPQGG